MKTNPDSERTRYLNPAPPLGFSRFAPFTASADRGFSTTDPSSERSRALDFAGQALALLGGDVQVVARAGLIYEQAGKRDLAVEMINRALKLGFPIAYLEAQPELADLLRDPRLVKGPAHE